MPHFTDEKTEDQRGKMAFSRAQSRKALKPKSAAGRGVRGGCSARLGVGDPAAHLSPGEASRATTERKRCPRAMPVWAGGGALVGSGRRQTQAPEAAPAEGSIESPGCPLALCAAALAAQRFSPHPPEGGSAQPVGRRAGLAAEEGAPPSAPLPAPAPPPPPPRSHLRGSHKGAGLPAHGRADKGSAEPATLFLLPAPGSEAAGRLAPPNSLPARPRPHRTRCAPRWGTPQTTRAHTDSWTHPPTHHIHSSISTHGPQHFTHTCAQADGNTPLCAQVPIPTLPTLHWSLLYRHPLSSLKWTQQHKGTSTHVPRHAS